MPRNAGAAAAASWQRLPWGLLQTVQSFLGFFFRGFPTDGMSIWNKLSRWSHPVFYYSLERIYTDTSPFSFTPA